MTGTNIRSQQFPCHSFPIRRINNRFDVTGANSCGYDTVRFTFDGDSAFHSWRWYFGDGDSADGKSVVHQYIQPGNYYVRLACGLGTCGYKQWVGDSVSIKFKPNLSFKTTKSIYCGFQTVNANINYKYIDTLQLFWGDGTDTMLVDSSNNMAKQIQFQHQYHSSGIYTVSCKAKNANCYDSAAIIYPIKIDSSPTTAFTANNLASCGASTFTFTDTSSFDTIIQYRYWHIQNVGFDTLIGTVANKNLVINLSDTGAYHVSLKVVSFQGCVDSLTKPNYIRVNPLPDATISPSGQVQVCFNDSVKLILPSNSKYLWNNNDTNQTIIVKKQGVYSATVWNQYNCNATSNKVTVSFLAPFNANIKLSANKDTLYILANRSISNYVWLKDSLAFSGNTGAKIINPAPGKYTANVGDSFGCSATAVSYTVLNGISNLMMNSISVYPNPTRDELTIENIPANITQYILSDISGKILIKKSINGAQQVKVSLMHVASGIYILQVGEQVVKVVVER